MTHAIRHLPAAALAALTLAAAVPAGAVLRVGPTRAFGTIQAAVYAATHGDLILVDPGTYLPFDVPVRGIAILSAGATPFTIAPSNSRPAIRIFGTPTGQTTTVMGFQTTVAFGAAPPVEIFACNGTVRLEDAVIDPTVNLVGVPMRAVIEIRDCAAVTLYDVQINPAAPRDGRTTNGIPAPVGTDEGICAVSAKSSKVHLQRCQIRGYDNLSGGSNVRWGGDGLRLLDASIARIDDAPSLYRGGAGGEFGGSAIHLIAVNPVADVLSCAVPSFSYVKGPAPSPGGFFGVNHDRGIVGMFERFVPACLGTSAGFVVATSRMSINNVYTVTVASLYSRLYLLYLGPTTIQPIPGVQNTAYLDYFSPLTAVVASGALPAPPLPPVVGVQLPIPNSPALIGYQFGAQAALGPPTGQAVPALSFTLASIAVITP